MCSHPLSAVGEERVNERSDVGVSLRQHGISIRRKASHMQGNIRFACGIPK